MRALLRPASRDTPNAWARRAEVIRADLRGATDLEGLFDGIDSVVHLAATVRGSPEAQFAGTVVATERLLAAMARAHATTHLVLAGSCAVYDWTAARRVLDEDTPTERWPYHRDGYTVAKVWQERVARRMADEHRWTLSILRPGLIYGPGGVPASSAGIGSGRVFFVIAPLSRLRLTHVDNCAAAFVRAVEQRAGGTFNIVDDEHVSAWRYAHRLLRSDSRAIRVPVPYVVGLGLAHIAALASRLLFPPAGGKLPGILKPTHYRARFKPMRYDLRRAKVHLGWKSEPLFSTGSEVI